MLSMDVYLWSHLSCFKQPSCRPLIRDSGISAHDTCGEKKRFRPSLVPRAQPPKGCKAMILAAGYAVKMTTGIKSRFAGI